LGEYFKRLFINRMHYPVDAVAVTGSPRYDILVRRDLYDKEHLRNKLRLSAEKFTILLATAGATMKSDFQPPHNNRVHLAAVLDCLDELDDVQLIVKLHPLDDTSLSGSHLERANSHPAVRVVKDEDILALLSVSDLLIARYSGTIIEAAIFDKPSINLNLLETPDNIEFVAKGGAFGITERDRLLEGMHALMDPDSQANRKLRNNRAEFISQWVHTIDGKAAARVVEVIVDLSDAASNPTASGEKDKNA
jgi:CDP-glycerol glycerophosphotransferase (TagB/SpsB family)